LGVDWLWRDGGFAVGTVLAGIIANAYGMVWAVSRILDSLSG